MDYVSTRGQAGAHSTTVDFRTAVLAGLARDGGLLVPAQWPRLDLSDLAGRPYAEVATRVLAPFAAPSLDEATVAQLARAAYAGFDHKSVAPLSQIGDGLWLLELFHGPTLAFKDVALQLLGRLFDHLLAGTGRHLTILGATSGDTGSAAIEACRGSRAVDIFILLPEGRTSPVQRLQMTTVADANVHAIQIDGTFDDCQAIVKTLFADRALADELALSAVNSINWARIAAQAVYYVTAALALGSPGRKVAFAVPTGNFGNVLAAYVAHRMGLPIERLLVATNANDIVHRFFATGRMAAEPVKPTLSPAMDIQVSSNLERLLFELFDRDPARLRGFMESFRTTGTVDAEAGLGGDLFESASVDDAGTSAEIARTHAETGRLIDPHTAVGLAAARRLRPRLDPSVPLVSLACAHPAKFPEAVVAATGQTPRLPERLADLARRPERTIRLPARPDAVAAYLRTHARAGASLSRAVA